MLSFYILFIEKAGLKLGSSTQTDFSRGGPYFPAKILVRRTKISRTKIPVRDPAVTMIGVSSSSDADQLRFITACTNSVSEYSTPIETSTGIAITDCLRFFTADTPANQFEAGCKWGGKQKCVLCGCLAHLHDDFAYCAHQSLLSCTDQQMLVLAGRFGRTLGAMKPLSERDLRVPQNHNLRSSSVTYCGVLCEYQHYFQMLQNFHQTEISVTGLQQWFEYQGFSLFSSCIPHLFGKQLDHI